MFGDTVMGVDHHHFEHELSAVKKAKGVKLDTDLDADDLKEVVERYKAVYEKHVGDDFPQDPFEQLEAAIEAVFKSWMGDRAINYREIERHPRPARHGRQRAGDGLRQHGRRLRAPASPSPATRRTGENVFYGEFLINAQGEDVVAGIRTPLECKTEMGKWSQKSWKELLDDQEDAREALQGRAGLRVHDREGQAVHAPDPQRQADRRRRPCGSPSRW